MYNDVLDAILLRNYPETSTLLTDLRISSDLGATPSSARRTVDIETVLDVVRGRKREYDVIVHSSRFKVAIFTYAALLGVAITLSLTIYLAIRTGEWPVRTSMVTSALCSICLFSARLYNKRAEQYEVLQLQYDRIEIALVTADSIGGKDAFNTLRQSIVNSLLAKPKRSR